jgi:ferritin
MIDKKLEDALNNQVNAELYSAYIYLAMAAYFEGINLGGFSKWMRVQAQEEVGHAMKIFDFVFERDGQVELAAIEKPALEWKSPLDAFQAAYNHEQKVTGMIHDLVELARSNKDYATENFLGWFVEEQVEEESSALEIVNNLKLIKDSPNGMFMLDARLGQRGS